MRRRWIIRSLAVLLLAVCGTAWVSTYCEYTETLAYRGKSMSYSMSFCWQGRCALVFGRIDLTGKGWKFEHRSHTRLTFSDSWGDVNHSLLGFRLSYSYPVNGAYLVEIPFWFLTVCCAAFLGLVWRETRSKQVGRAFPVETTATVEPGDKVGLLR